jgi:hypothetical protein
MIVEWLNFQGENAKETARLTGLPCYASRDLLYLETGWEKLIDKRIDIRNSCNANPLKQLSACRHVAPFGHIILIPSQPIFALTVMRAYIYNKYHFIVLVWPDRGSNPDMSLSRQVR